MQMSSANSYTFIRLINIINGLKKGYVIWQEVIDNGVKVTLSIIVNCYRLLKKLQIV